MNIRLHANATCTPAIRKYIWENRDRPTAVLQRELGLTERTVKRWKSRSDGQDKSSRPHMIHSSFEEWQELLIVEIRRDLLLPIDDLLVVVQRFLLPSCTRSSLNRLLKRYGVSDLRALMPKNETQKEKGKGSFKPYPPGFLHMDVKYLPKMPDEAQHSYLFVAIDRATRWVFLEVYPHKTAANARDFLAKVKAAFPGEIQKLLTDNGKEFTDRFSPSGEREPTGEHLLDQLCAELGIEHRLTKPRTPQTNGMVERFNGRIKDLLARNRVASARELKNLLLYYRETYNNVIPQRALNHQTPNQALQNFFGHANLTEPDRYDLGCKNWICWRAGAS